MQRLTLAVAILGLFAVAAQAAIAAEPYKTLPDADTVKSAIDREGASAVLWDRLFASARGPAFSPFLRKVEAGDPAWIRVATQLRGVSDAGVSLMLDQSLTLALPRSPAAVLDVLAQSDGVSQFSLRDICSGDTFLEDEPRKRVLAWYTQSEQALVKLQQPSLSAKRDECLKSIRAGRKMLTARKREGK